LRAAWSPSATRRRFAFDCEGPRHQVLLQPYLLCSHPVSNHQWFEFIEDGGYQSAGLWLSDGWRWVCDNQIEAPLYWEERDGTWWQMSLRGMQPVDPDSPVTHELLRGRCVRALGGAAPTEAEWEHAAQSAGHRQFHRRPRAATAARSPEHIGRPAPDVRRRMGMDRQRLPALSRLPTQRRRRGRIQRQVHEQPDGAARRLLRHAESHIRASYRNFFYPHQRWQFTGLRLADDA
jgi:formylglycine-generating enzyme required for sulfatase activity